MRVPLRAAQQMDAETELCNGSGVVSGRYRQLIAAAAVLLGVALVVVGGALFIAFGLGGALDVMTPLGFFLLTAGRFIQRRAVLASSGSQS